jgi:cellobiose-specific phosphotransferase system component IIA
MSLFGELDSKAAAMMHIQKAKKKQAEDAAKKLEQEKKAKQEAHDHKDSLL